MPHDFLLQLPQFRLPHKVTAPEEIRWASLLTATGLIESESWPRLSMTKRFSSVKYTWIERITPEGFAEIACLQLQALKAADQAVDLVQPLPEERRDPNRVPQTTWISTGWCHFPELALGPNRAL